MTIWKNRNFLWLISGQTISQFGSAISTFAVPWILLQLTGSALQMGLAFAVGFVPYLLISLPAGVWADRFDRKRMMILADLCRGLLLAIIPLASLFDELHVWELYTIEAGLSAFSAVFDTAYVACLPNVVEREQLSEGNAALQACGSASQILGPPLAGMLVGFVGSTNTIVIDVGSFLISVISLLAIRKSFSALRSADSETSAKDNAKEKMLPQIREGLQFVWGHRLIRTLSLFTLVCNLATTGATAILLYHIQRDLHISSTWTGVVLSGYSVGVLLGSVISGFLGKRLSMGGIMCIALAILAAMPFVLSIAEQPWLIGLAMLGIGFGAAIWNVQSVSLRQSVIPDHLLGRASSAIRMVVWGSIPVGSAVGGALGETLGAPVVFMIGGVMHVGIFLWGLGSSLYKTSRVQMGTEEKLSV